MKNPRKKSSRASKSIKKGTRPDSLHGTEAYVYTRAQAVADGVQVDVCAMALKVGFGCPVYITATIYALCVVKFGKAVGVDEAASLKRFLETVLQGLIHVAKPRITMRYVALDEAEEQLDEVVVIIAQTTQDTTNRNPAIVVMALGED